MFGYIKFGIAIAVILFFITEVTYYKNKNYKLSEKIKQLESMYQMCDNNLNNLNILYNGLNGIYNLNIEDLENENNDTNDTVIFDFNRL